MTNAVRIKLIMAVLGLVVWGLAARFESPPFQWVGIGILALAFLMRFATRKEKDDSPRDETNEDR